MVVIDSSVWIDFFGGISNEQTSWMRESVRIMDLAFTDLAMCELLQGVRDDRDFQRALADLERFVLLPALENGIAVKAAQNYRALRAKGITVSSTIDCIIATFCIENGHYLLHRDRDFDAFEKHLGLRVIHPQARSLH